MRLSELPRKIKAAPSERALISMYPKVDTLVREYELRARFYPGTIWAEYVYENKLKKELFVLEEDDDCWQNSEEVVAERLFNKIQKYIPK